MEYELRSGSNVAHAARKINDVYGANTTNKRTTCYCFACFRSVNFTLKIEPRGHPKTLIDNDELKTIVEADDELAAAFDVRIKTILVY
ncbi:unnamed protein product [Parnassius mnemosyne]|uniref:Mos1 transposase HTH domain-containing protein n=1 Tax=Parnassius mnemosyne TaxID=213953 RepID=A0AAV1LN77_9NEOP